MRQANALARRNGRSLEEAKEAVSDTEAGRQLRDLANGEHRHEKARAWQAGVFWGRVEERFMHRIGSGVRSRLVAERHSSGGQGALGIEGGRKASTSERAGARMPSR